MKPGTTQKPSSHTLSCLILLKRFFYFFITSCVFLINAQGTITKVQKSRTVRIGQRTERDFREENPCIIRRNPHTQTESFQVECQLCLRFMNFTHFARSHLCVIQVLQTNQAGHDKWLPVTSGWHLSSQRDPQAIKT